VPRPWLSVIMPTYNGDRYLSLALESVLVQHDSDVEIIAVDDGSEDRTLDILRSYAARMPLQVLQHKHSGNWVATSNHGLAVAQAEHACILHQDDLWLLGRLAALRRLVEARSDMALILHATRFIGPQGEKLGTWRCPLPASENGLDPEFVVERLMVANFVAMPAPLFRRDLALQAGGMDESLWFLADWDLWLKLAAAGKSLYLPRTLAAFRIHGKSQTVQRTSHLRDLDQQYASLHKRHLEPWLRCSPERANVGRVAQAAWDLARNLTAHFHHQPTEWSRWLLGCTWLGFAGWHRLLRDSRIMERVAARLRLARSGQFKNQESGISQGS